MTRDEAIKMLRGMKADNLNLDDLYTKDKYEALDMAIKALKQESVLGSVRAVIENHCGIAKENHCKYCSYCNSVMGVREILEVIDKYKTGTENK